MRPPFWKRSYIIQPRLQLELTLYLSFFTIMALIVIYLSVRVSINAVLQQAAGLNPSCTTIVELSQETIKTILTTVFATNGFVVFLFAFVGGILISHRVAGPIFRFKKVLRQLADGVDPGKISIRKHDYFPEMIPLLEELKRIRETEKTEAVSKD